jgi:phosphatidylethanolamine/phosphatidyl-N-methylethanolamine N-methyltransferase
MDIWNECGSFFNEFRRQFRTTGAIMPSSPFLARALAKPLRGPHPACRILEVGPGTGSVTREIVRRMLPGDRLDAVEINERFVALLERRLDRDRVFHTHRQDMHIIHARVQDLLGEAVYDYIVSGLPLNNFTPRQVREIFATYNRLLKPGGTLTYYEYVLVRELKTPFVNRRERCRLFSVGRVVRDYIREYQIHRERVFVNVPPATVRHLRFNPAPRRAGPGSDEESLLPIR